MLQIHEEAGTETGETASALPSVGRLAVRPPQWTAEDEGRTASALWYLAAAIAAWACGYTIMRGSDLWWHLANGHWILRHQAIPLTDSWSFTRAGAPWNNEAWLAGVIFELWRRLFGLATLAWWKWLVLVSAWVLLFHTVRRTGRSSLEAFVAVVFGALVAAPFLDVRPQLYSFLGYSLLLHLAFERERPSWSLPLVFLLWANLHALVLFGLLALAVLLVPALRRAPVRSALLGFLCFAAAMVNPLGIGVATRALDYALRRGSPFRTLGEWRPPFQAGGLHSPLYPLAIALFAAAIVLALVTLRGRWRELPWTAVGLGLLTLAMSLTSRRFVPLFAMSQALLVRWMLARLAPRMPQRVHQALPAAALVLGLIRLWPYPQSSDAFLYLTAEDTFPVELCDFIAANGISGKVFAYYNWGGYLHFRTDGALRVYIDGRADMVFDDETYERYVDVLRQKPGWLAIVEGSGAELVLWPRGEPMLAELIGTGRWRLLHEDAVGALLRRATLPAAAALESTPVTAWSELSAGVLSVERDRLAAAETHYRRALRRMPHLGAACYGLAEAQAKQRRFEAALAQIDACQSIYPDRAKAAQSRHEVAQLGGGKAPGG